MTTRGSGLDYEHPNIVVQDVDELHDFGWYKIFRTIVPATHLKLSCPKIRTEVSVLGNLQSLYYDLIFKDLKGLDAHAFASIPQFKITWVKSGLWTRFFSHSKIDQGRMKLMLSGDDVIMRKPGFFRNLFGEKLSSFFWGDIGEDKTSSVYQKSSVSQQKTMRYGSTLDVHDLDEKVKNMEKAQRTIECREAISEHYKELRRTRIKYKTAANIDNI